MARFRIVPATSGELLLKLDDQHTVVCSLDPATRVVKVAEAMPRQNPEDAGQDPEDGIDAPVVKPEMHRSDQEAEATLGKGREGGSDKRKQPTLGTTEDEFSPWFVAPYFVLPNVFEMLPEEPGRAALRFGGRAPVTLDLHYVRLIDTNEDEEPAELPGDDEEPDRDDDDDTESKEAPGPIIVSPFGRRLTKRHFAGLVPERAEYLEVEGDFAAQAAALRAVLGTGRVPKSVMVHQPASRPLDILQLHDELDWGDDDLEVMVLVVPDDG